MLHLQPMDMLGMDYPGPITPTPESGNLYVYTLVIVDHFLSALLGASCESEFQSGSRSCYHGSKSDLWLASLSLHRQQRSIFPRLATRSNEGIGDPPPKTHPQSVCLSERYVQLITFSCEPSSTSSPQPGRFSWWALFMLWVVEPSR